MHHKSDLVFRRDGRGPDQRFKKDSVVVLVLDEDFLHGPDRLLSQLPLGVEQLSRQLVALEKVLNILNVILVDFGSVLDRLSHLKVSFFR